MDQALRRILADRDEAAIDDGFFDNACPHFFTVDWREDDADIVEYCAGCIGDPSLKADWQDDDSLVILRDGVETIVPLQQGDGDRHITLSALNHVLAPDFEIRFLVCSHGGDTAGFAALPSADWKALETDFPEATRENFIKLRDLPNIFTEMNDSHLPPEAAARYQRMLERYRIS